DTVTLTGTASTLTGDMSLGGGDDIVTIQEDATATGNVDLGDGTNQFDISGTADLTGTITGGADVDTVTITDDSTVTGDIDLGAGANVLTINTTADHSGTITAGDGNDTVTLTGTASTLTGDMSLGDGDDTVTIDGSATAGGNVDLGDGTNTFNINDDAELTGNITGGADVDAVNITNNAIVGGAIDLGDGADSFTIAEDATYSAILTSGAGADTISITDRALVTGNVDLGDGTNLFTIDEDATYSADLTSGVGADTVSITDRATVTGNISLGDGNDTLTIDADASYEGTIDAGAGADNISFLSSTTTLSGGVNLGDGTDSFTIDAATYAGDVEAVAGTNTISIQNQATFSGAYTGGEDADIFDISSDSASSGLLDLGDGVNSVTVAGGNATTLFTSSIVGGEDADVVRLQAGARYGVDAGGSRVELGEGDDSFTTGRDQVIFADVDLGRGDDTFTIGSPDSNATSEFNGDVDLGQTEDDPDASNVFTLSDDALMIGDVDGGAGVDQIDVLNNAELRGDVDLGGGADFVNVGPGATIGTIDAGDGDDQILVFINASITGDVIAGGGADNLTLNSGSSITGTVVDLGAGDDVVVYNTTDELVPGSIELGIGADTFVLESGATLPTIASDVDADVDTLHLDRRLIATQVEGVVDLSTATEFQALRIGPDIQEDGYRWRVSTSGNNTVTFTDDIVLQSGAFIPEGTVRLTSNFIQNGGAPPPTAGDPAIPAPVMVFELGAGGPTDPSNSHLELTGELTLVGRDLGADLEDPGDDAPGAASRVDFTGTIVDGTYTLITASDGIATDVGTTEGFDVETFPVSAAFSFSTAIVAGVGAIESYELTVLRELIYSDFARSDSEANVGDYFEDARSAGAATAFSDVTNALDLLSAGDLRTALAQSSPEVYDAHTSSVLSWGRVQQRVLQERSMRCDRYTYTPQPEIVSDSPCGTTGFMPWAKVAGDIRERKGGESSGYESMGGGVLLGFDYRWDDTLWLSGDIGFARIDIEHDNGADADFDSVDLGVAAGGEFFGVTTRGSLTYSHGFHETTRKIDFLNERAKGKHDSDRVTLAAGAGYRLKAGPFVVEPNATVDYTHVEEDSVDESGAGAVDLDVSSRKTDVVSLTGGVRLGANLLKYRYAGNWLEWADGVWSPGVSVGWRQGFGDIDRDQNAMMQGAPGVTESFKAEAEDSAGGVEVGAHLAFQPLNTATSVEVGYDGYFGDDVTNHSANVSVRVPF
ncbi:MAG: autotransporter domain-containing protein, partial [Myxococcota bacterium]